MNAEKTIKQLRNLQKKLQEVVDEADPVFPERPYGEIIPLFYKITWAHIQTLNEIIGNGD